MVWDESIAKHYYSKSNSKAFTKWFEKLCKNIKERPFLLIYDGHMTHATIPVIILAIKENVILVKLPSHSNDLLQILDNTYFSSLRKSLEQ